MTTKSVAVDPAGFVGDVARNVIFEVARAPSELTGVKAVTLAAVSKDSVRLSDPAVSLGCNWRRGGGDALKGWIT